jgi:hypothetical protein
MMFLVLHEMNLVVDTFCLHATYSGSGQGLSESKVPSEIKSVESCKQPRDGI